MVMHSSAQELKTERTAWVTWDLVSNKLHDISQKKQQEPKEKEWSFYLKKKEEAGGLP